MNILIENNRFYVSPRCREITKTLINLIYRPGTSEVLKDNIYDHFGDLIRYVVNNTFPLNPESKPSTPIRRTSGAYI